MHSNGKTFSRKQRRTWFIPALIAAVSFIGGIAGNLLASDLEGVLKSYRIWVWLLCIVALIIAIIAAIRDRLQSDELLLAQSRTGQQNPLPSSVVSIQGDSSKIYLAPKLAANALHQIPPPPHDFTGREVELNDLMQKMQEGGVVISALRGQGGVGKTTLALKLAEQLKDIYPDGQFYLDLRGADSQSMPVADALAYVIRAYHPGIELPKSEAELRAIYLSVLHNRRALLLMDNARDKQQVEPLIPPAGCALLVTSRQHFTLPGLYPKNLDSLSSADACKLVLTIAPRIGELAEELAKLCGYLPLALRLAASLIAERPNIKPEDYLRRLASEEKRLELVEASLNLSYELLSAEMQERWRALAVFPNTFDEAAAAAVWGIGDDITQECLSELFAFSFVEWNGTSGRYRLHDLVHVFADSRTNETEREAAKKRHAAHYLKVLATANDLFLKGGEEIRLGLALFDTEWGNISAGQSWASTRVESDETAAELCISYPEAGVDILHLRQHPRERIQWLEVTRNTAQSLGRRDVEGRAINHLGAAYVDLGEMERAIGLYEQSLVIACEVGDRRGEGLALEGLGFAYYYLGKIRHAIDIHEQALAIIREIGDRRVEGHTLRRLGLAYSNLGLPRKAIELNEQALNIARETGDRRGEGIALYTLGLSYSNLSKLGQAIEFFERALVIEHEIGDRGEAHYTLNDLGFAYYCLGKTGRAIEFFEQSLAIAREIGDRRGSSYTLNNLGWAYLDLGLPRLALEFSEQALAIACETENHAAEGNSLNNLGRVYSNLGNLKCAIEFYEQALAITRETEDRLEDCFVLNNLGLVYSNLGEAKRAIELSEMALTIARKIGHCKGEGEALRGMGIAYTILGDTRRAIEFFEQSLAITREIGDRREEGRVLGNLGEAYCSLNERDRALNFYQQALAISRETSDRINEGQVLWNMALAFTASGEWARSIASAEEALVIYEQIESPSAEMVRNKLAEWKGRGDESGVRA